MSTVTSNPVAALPILASLLLRDMHNVILFPRPWRRVLGMLLLMLASGGAVAAVAQPAEGTWRQLRDLRGSWRFQIGDDAAWADPGLDDSGWDNVLVPSAWEDEGYPGYDGYAWYRHAFHLDPRAKGRYLYLHLGRIDDVDQVFVNGYPVGATGGFPPGYRTGYQHFRAYRLPENILRYGRDNVIAVRVFDDELSGGMLEGPVGLYERLDHPPLVVDLAGSWGFRTGDDPRWKEEKISGQGWQPIQVPVVWEAQGFPRYDGYAWYRTDFVVPERYRQQELVLLLGKIDDLDEAYLNGVRVGRTGDLQRPRISGDEWQRLRAYPLPAGTVRHGAPNTLAVRVYDDRYDGGIFEGPVGVVTREAFERWHIAGDTSLWQWLYDWLFGQ